ARYARDPRSAVAGARRTRRTWPGGRARCRRRARPPPARAPLPTGSDSPPASQRLPQPMDGAEQMTLHAALADAERRGHLGGGQVLHVAQHEDLPLAGRERAKRLPDVALDLGADGQVGRARFLHAQGQVLHAVAATEARPPADPPAVAAAV